MIAALITVSILLLAAVWALLLADRHIEKLESRIGSLKVDLENARLRVVDAEWERDEATHKRDNWRRAAIGAANQVNELREKLDKLP